MFRGFQGGEGELLPAEGAWFNGKRGETMGANHPQADVSSCNKS
jgi:hypothetical protein